MVKAIIAWISRLLGRHGYVLLSNEEYVNLLNVNARTRREVNDFKKDTVNVVSRLDRRITELEAWKDAQPPEPKPGETYTAAQLLDEWINGEAKLVDR